MTGGRCSWFAAGVVLVLGLAPSTTQAEASAPPGDSAASHAAIAPPKLGGYLTVRETWLKDVGLTATIHRARLSADGTLPSRFSYRITAEFEAASATGPATVSLRDALIRWTRAPLTVTAGQFKVPMSREYITSITAIETAERAIVVDALAPKRDVGVMVEGTAWGPTLLAQAGVFNGEGQNATANRDSTVLCVGRLAFRPHAFVSVAGSGAWWGDDSTRAGIEANLEAAGFLVRGEFLTQRRHGAGVRDRGAFALVGYRVTPWLQLVTRWEEFRRPVGTTVAASQAMTYGATVDLPGGRTRLMLNAIARRNAPSTERRVATIAQAQVKF